MSLWKRFEERLARRRAADEGAKLKIARNALARALDEEAEKLNGGKMIESMLLGLVAYRVGKKIQYDGAAGKTDSPEANELLSRKYRAGWTLDG